MNADDRPRFAARLATVYRTLASGTTITPDVLEAYWRALKHLDIEVFLVACAKAEASLVMFPKPVELRRLVGDLPGSDNPRPNENTFGLALDRDDRRYTETAAKARDVIKMLTQHVAPPWLEDDQ